MKSSSIFGNGCSVRLPFALLSTLTTVGCNAFNLQKSIHILLLGGLSGADFFGTITIGLAQGDTLQVMIPVLSNCSTSFCTQS